MSESSLTLQGGAVEYIHRVGRTARAGRAGAAWAFLLPTESEWVPWVESRMSARASGAPVSLRQVDVDEILRNGFGGANGSDEYHDRATDVQMGLERWVEAEPAKLTLARAAFMAHVRAYATHPSEEKAFFHVRSLHLGHLAKAFGLREAPSGLGVGGASGLPSKRQRKAEALDAHREGKQPITGRAREGKGLKPARPDVSEFNVV